MDDMIFTKRFGNWGMTTDEDSVPHMVPLDDLQPHLYEDCPCRPELADGVTTHNSFDGREDFETLKRLPS